MGPEVMSICLKKEGFIFDMPGACKYYTRLMSGRLTRTYKLAELSALTEPLDATLSVSELPRFVEALAVEQSDQAQVRSQLSFDAESDHKVTVSGSVQASVLTQCQRCLEGLPLELEVPIYWRLPDDFQGDGEKVDPRGVEVRLLDWIEDDLQLAIPLFAKHDDENCGGELTKHYAATDEEHVPDTATPFEGLKDLLSKQ